MEDEKIGYKSVIDFGRSAKVYFPHNIGDYPTKILPQVIKEFILRFSNEEELILDPFCGSGTTAVECYFNKRFSINIDINPKAIEIAKEKLKAIENSFFVDKGLLKKQVLIISDARDLPIKDESVDLILTDIPYADMIKYSNLENDLSNIEDYQTFLIEISKAFGEMKRVLKRDKYAIIFCADYRLGKSRLILPIHSDVINLMLDLGFVLFDLYIWRYYRSGSFRPFGSPPYQSMNTHTYILVFQKRNINQITKNRPVRYRKRLIEKLNYLNNS
ncbi:MAG: DNA methyltransferase [candidate division WOR-3 bacterium]